MSNISEKDATPDELEQIQEEFEKTLIIPSVKPTKQWLLMPVGLIGAGKTTVVKPLAEHFNLIRLSTDEVRKIMTEQGYSYEGCRDIISNLQRKYLSLGYSIALDANTGSKHGLEYNARTKEAFPSVPQIFIHIDPPEEFILHKLNNYKHTWLFKDGNDAVEAYLKNKESFIVPNVDFAYTFDTSREDLPEQIKEGIEKLQEILNNN